MILQKIMTNMNMKHNNDFVKDSTNTFLKIEQPCKQDIEDL